MVHYTLPPGTIVDRMEGGVRISLPPRPVEHGRCAALFLIPFGAVFAGGPLWGAIGSAQGEGGCFAIFALAFALPFVLAGLGLVGIGLGLLFPRRNSVLLDRTRLKMTERFGPFWWSGEAPREKISGFQVRRLPVKEGKTVTGALRVDVPGRPKELVLGRGYPAEWLEALAVALSETHGSARVSESVEAPEPARPDAPPAARGVQPEGSDLVLEYAADSVRLRIPPRGIWKANGCLLLFGILWSAMSGIGVATALVQGDWGAVAFVLLFVAVGVALILGSIHSGIKTATVELSGASLILRKSGVFGRSLEQWPRSSLQSFGVEDSGWRVNDVVQWRLRVERAGGKAVKLLRGRSKEELEWIASVLRSGPIGRVEAAPGQMKAAGSECQVCNSPMTTDIVYCARCKTPHHGQCWLYLGQCSTYGCREIRYTTS